MELSERSQTYGEEHSPLFTIMSQSEKDKKAEKELLFQEDRF